MAGTCLCSGYTRVDETEHPAEYINRLDRLAATSFWRAVKELSYKRMRAGDGDRILDVGCGTGDDARALAAHVAPHGSVVGIDTSATMISEASARAARTHLSVQFHQADAAQLDFDDAVFDACRAERVLQHVAEPARVIAEMIRVLRHGGRLVAVEPDYRTLRIDGGEATTTRSIVHSRVEHFRSGHIGAELPRLFHAAGMCEIGVTIRRLGSHSFHQDREQLRKYVDGAQSAGAISTEAGSSWLAQLEAADRAAAYSQTLAVFIVGATKL